MSLKVIEDRIEDLRRIYDTNLENIAAISLRTAVVRPEPIPQQPQRVMQIYGMRVANQGPTRDRPDEMQTNSVVFRRGNTRTVDIWPVDTLETAPDQMVYARTPLLFRRGDEMTVDFVPRQVDGPALLQSGDTLPNLTDVYQPTARGDLGNPDNIQLLGRVVEALGDVITGPDPVQRVIQRPGRKEPTPDQVAQKLFFSYLSKEDKQTWIKHKVILVPSKARPAFTYEITPSLVYLLNEKKERIEQYCFIASENQGYIPQHDITLSKYLLLQANEARFCSIAIRTRLGRPQRNAIQEQEYWQRRQTETGQPQTVADRLRARAETIDVGTIGLQGGLYQGFTPTDIRALEDAVVRFGVAQAVLDGISNTADGLVVRDILPDRDLSYRRRATNRT